MGALTDLYQEHGIENLFPRPEAFSPCPDHRDRRAWSRVPEGERNRILSVAAPVLDREWSVLPATRYLDYARTGDRDRYQKIYMERRVALAHLAVAECLEDRGRHLDAILDLVWALCEETSWCLPAHQGWHGNPDGLPDGEDPVIDLFAAETAAILAMVFHLLGDGMDGLSPHVRRRAENQVRKRIFEPFFKVDHYHWMALENDFINNHTPWTCSNVLLAFLLFEKDRPTLHRALAKMIRGLDRYFDGIPEDGGCDEGPRYWTLSAGSFFECLEVLHGSSSGKFDLFSHPKLKEMGAFLPRVHIDGDWFVNFADGNARVSIPTGLCHRFGQKTGDPSLMRLAVATQGAFGHHTPPSENNYKLYRLARHALHQGEMRREDAVWPALKEAWLPRIQVLTARETQGENKGLFVAVKGGHNGESHNHNDVGHLVVFSDGKPAVVDIGVEVYTAATFGPERYAMATMRSSYHNLLPRVNGHEQKDGRDFKARDTRLGKQDENPSLSLDIAGAYPQASGLAGFRRQVTLVRGQSAKITVTDKASFRTMPDSFEMSLMTAGEPALEKPGHLVIPVTHGRSVGLDYDGGLFQARIETLELTDESLRFIWGPRLYRTVFHLRNMALTTQWRFNFYQKPAGANGNGR